MVKTVTVTTTVLPRCARVGPFQTLTKRKDCQIFLAYYSFVIEVSIAGLSITLLAADRPTPYITRITKIKDLSISSDASHFTGSILPLIVLVWQFKQQILKMKNQVFFNKERNYPKDTSEWLNTCLNHDNVVIMPVTSTSTEYVSKRRKVDSWIICENIWYISLSVINLCNKIKYFYRNSQVSDYELIFQVNQL